VYVVAPEAITVAVVPAQITVFVLTTVGVETGFMVIV
jgi:hypothetical protein